MGINTFCCLCHWPVCFCLPLFSPHVFPPNLAVTFYNKQVRICIFFFFFLHLRNKHLHSKVMEKHEVWCLFQQTLDPSDPSALTAKVLTWYLGPQSFWLQSVLKCCLCIGGIYGVIIWWEVIDDCNSIAGSVDMQCFYARLKSLFHPFPFRPPSKLNSFWACGGERKKIAAWQIEARCYGELRGQWRWALQRVVCPCKTKQFTEERGNNLFWRANEAI